MFDTLKIDYSQPGFYNDHNFQMAERTDNNFLRNYGAFINKETFTTEYIKKANYFIPKIVKAFSVEVIKDGGLGRCVNTSIVLSQILQKNGFWNYLVKGSVTITFPPAKGIPEVRFFTIDIRNDGPPHVWLVAPPLTIIDTAIKLQPYNGFDPEILPEFICTTKHTKAVAKHNDLINEVLTDPLIRSGRKSNLIKRFMPYYPDFAIHFPAKSVSSNNIKLKYIPTAITAPIEDIDNNPYLINGLSAMELNVKIQESISNEI